MESAVHISEEWSSLSGVYTAEEADFMHQLLGNCAVPQQFYEPANTNYMCFLQGSSSSSADNTNIFPTTSGVNCTNSSVTNFGYMPMCFSVRDSKFSPHRVQGNDSKHLNENIDDELGQDTGTVVLADKNLQTHKKREILVSEPEEDKTRSRPKSGKRCRSSNEVPKNNRNVKSKKNTRSASISTEEDISPGPQDQTCCSDDDSNASLEQRGGSSSSLSLNDSSDMKLSSKSTSSRGPATDPQSVYARRRRERINERLRILQSLVPNGTKVDISTMLEEAVQYVKFLQLQIKLLSSDDMWMYAPIAYNGMNIGLELNLPLIKESKDMHIIAANKSPAV